MLQLNKNVFFPIFNTANYWPTLQNSVIFIHSMLLRWCVSHALWSTALLRFSSTEMTIAVHFTVHSTSRKIGDFSLSEIIRWRREELSARSESKEVRIPDVQGCIYVFFFLQIIRRRFNIAVNFVVMEFYYLKENWLLVIFFFQSMPVSNSRISN